MTNKTELERLVAVETNLDNLIKAVDRNTQDTKQAFEKINTKLEAMSQNYVNRADYDKDKEELKSEIEAAKRKSGLQVWLTGTLSAVFGVVMTILVQAFFN